MRSKLALIAILVLCAAWPAAAQWSPLVPITNVTKESDGLRATYKSGAVLKLQVCSD